MPSTRRDILGAAAGLSSLALAGCQSLRGDSTPTEMPTTDPVTDYAVATLRRTDRAPYRYSGDDGGDEGQPLVLGSNDDLDALTFESPDSETEQFASFVRETDFQDWSILLYRRQIRQCYRQQVESVWWRPESLSVTLCRERLPADRECETGTRDEFAIAIRVPFPSDQFERLLTSISSECGARLGPRETEGGQ